MKQKKLLTVLIFFIGFCPEALFAQYTGEPDAMGVFLSGGYKSLRINHGNYDATTLEIGLHNHFNNIDFVGSFSYGKDYMSMEPFTLSGLLLYYFIKQGWSYADKETNIAMALCIFSGMGFNIRLADFLKIRPYYSLLRLTKIQKEEFDLNGAVGSYVTFEFGRMMLNPFCEYTFGYKKKSPFTGYAFGVSLGVKLYD